MAFTSVSLPLPLLTQSLSNQWGKYPQVWSNQKKVELISSVVFPIGRFLCYHNYVKNNTKVIENKAIVLCSPLLMNSFCTYK